MRLLNRREIVAAGLTMGTAAVFPGRSLFAAKRQRRNVALKDNAGAREAFDKNGKSMKKFRGTSGMGLHHQNFIDAVHSRDSSILKADVQVGQDSTGWCNLANVSYLSGQSFSCTDS